MSDLLESIRALLGDETTPRQARWTSLCQSLESETSETLAALGVEYASAHLADWSAHIRSVSFAQGTTQKVWWPLVRGLHFGDPEGVEELEGRASHITHVSLHEDAMLDSWDLEDLTWLPKYVPELRYFLLDGSLVDTLDALSDLQKLEDVVLLGYSSLCGTQSVRALNHLKHLRRLVVWHMAVENVPSLSLAELSRFVLLQLPLFHWMELEPFALDQLRTLVLEGDALVGMLDEAVQKGWDGFPFWVAQLHDISAQARFERLVLHFSCAQSPAQLAQYRTSLREIVPPEKEIVLIDQFQTYASTFLQLPPEPVSK